MTPFKMKGITPIKHGTTEDFLYGRKGHNPDIMEGSHEDWHSDKAAAEEKGEKFNKPVPPDPNPKNPPPN